MGLIVAEGAVDSCFWVETLNVETDGLLYHIAALNPSSMVTWGWGFQQVFTKGLEFPGLGFGFSLPGLDLIPGWGTEIPQAYVVPLMKNPLH